MLVYYIKEYKYTIENDINKSYKTMLSHHII